MNITIIVDNLASGQLLGEHGLCMLVEYKERKILFDSGQGLALEHNLASLNIHPAGITDFVLSHGHYDHTGGIASLAKMSGFDPRIYMHPAALCVKFAKNPDGARYIGISDENKKWLLDQEDKLTLSTTPITICPDIAITGEIPRINSIENRSTKFYLDKATSIPDPILDDQAMFLKTEKGIVVLLGCCHAGLANTMDYIAKLAETDNIYAVIGGTHLRNANLAQLDFAVATLAKYNVELFAPCHCSGQKSSAYLYSKNPEIFHECNAGTAFIFSDLN